MATNQTTNYQLNQWEPIDQVLRTDFNADNAKLDAALKSLSDQVIQKADASTVSALSQAVAAKAEQSALTEEISARTQADAVLAQKAGMQLIQQVQLVETNGYVNQPLSIDWDQWGSIWLVLRPKFSETTFYNAYFIPKPYIYFGEEVYGDLAVQLYPFFHKDMEINGHSWTGQTFWGDSFYQVVTVSHTAPYPGHGVAGSTLTVGGMK